MKQYLIWIKWRDAISHTEDNVAMKELRKDCVRETYGVLIELTPTHVVLGTSKDPGEKEPWGYTHSVPYAMILEARRIPVEKMPKWKPQAG